MFLKAKPFFCPFPKATDLLNFIQYYLILLANSKFNKYFQQKNVIFIAFFLLFNLITTLFSAIVDIFNEFKAHTALTYLPCYFDSFSIDYYSLNIDYKGSFIIDYTGSFIIDYII